MVLPATSTSASSSVHFSPPHPPVAGSPRMSTVAGVGSHRAANEQHYHLPQAANDARYLAPALAGKTATSLEDVNKPQESSTVTWLDRASTVGNMPFTMEFFVGLGLAKVAGFLHLPRAKLFFQKAAALGHAMKETPLNNLGKFGAAYNEQMGKYAQEAKDIMLLRHARAEKLIDPKAKWYWFEKAEDKAAAIQKAKAAIPDVAQAPKSIQKVAEKAAVWETRAAEKAAANEAKLLQKAAELAAKPAAVIDAKAAESLGGKVLAWRAGRHNDAVVNRLGKAEAALTQEPGFFNWLKRLVGMQTPVDLHPELSSISTRLADAKGLQGQARVDHMQGVARELQGIVANGSDAVKAQASHVIKAVTKAESSASAAHGYAEAAKAGWKGLGNVLAHSGGKLSLFALAMGIGGAAAVTSKVVARHNVVTQSDAIFDQVAASIGDKNNAYFQEIKKAHRSQMLGDVGRVTTDAVGEAAMAYTFAGMGAVNPVFHALAMIPMMKIEALGGVKLEASVSPVLMAANALMQEQANKVELSPEQKLLAVRQMIAVKTAKHGGIYNRLVTPVAQEMIAQKMDFNQMVQLLSNNAAFDQFLQKVQSKLQVAPAVQTVAVPHQPAANAPRIGAPNYAARAQKESLAKLPQESFAAYHERRAAASAAPDVRAAVANGASQAEYSAAAHAANDGQALSA